MAEQGGGRGKKEKKGIVVVLQGLRHDHAHFVGE